MKIRTTTLFISLILFVSAAAFGQTSAFNFQGRLNDGTSPANGRYDLQFRLFPTPTGGVQVALTLDRPNQLLINGVFSTVLDFGPSAFNGATRFIEISIRPQGSPNAYVVLGGRQQVLSVPYAAHAANASVALMAHSADNSLGLNGLPSSSYARLNFANQGDVSATNLGASGYISVGGNATQPHVSNGFPKAMITITGGFQTIPPTIANCYNGVTGSTTLPCGFAVTAPLGNVGVYHITLGFPVTSRFVSVTPYYSILGEQYGANIRVNAGNLEVFTFKANEVEDTDPNSFVVIVY